MIALNRHKWANNQPQSWYLIKYRHKIQQEQIFYMIYTANELILIFKIKDLDNKSFYGESFNSILIFLLKISLYCVFPQ